MPDFSVVIAAFNSAAWIVHTIRSALNQTYAAYEIIVIGDGCTDQTGDILRSNFGNAIRWENLDRNSGGQSYPNNEGIRISRGTHIAYLGHDDIWSPRHLEQLAGVIRTRDPDFAVSGAVYHGPPGSRYYQITGMFDDPQTAEREFFPPSSFAHRRDVVDRIGFWRDPNQLRAPADCEFLLRAAGRGCILRPPGPSPFTSSQRAIAIFPIASHPDWNRSACSTAWVRRGERLGFWKRYRRTLRMAPTIRRSDIAVSTTFLPAISIGGIEGPRGSRRRHRFLWTNPGD